MFGFVGDLVYVVEFGECVFGDEVVDFVVVCGEDWVDVWFF